MKMTRRQRAVATMARRAYQNRNSKVPLRPAHATDAVEQEALRRGGSKTPWWWV